MKTRVLVICLLLMSILLSACGPSKPAADVAATQTAQAPTATTRPTGTPVPTATTSPTDTPVPTATIRPTDTPIPTATPNALAGWTKFEGSGIEMWLPKSFVGGNLENDLERVVNHLKTLGPEFESVVATIEDNPSAFVLLAFDSELGSTGYHTNVGISKQQVVSVYTLDLYVQSLQQQLPSWLTILEHGQGKLELYDSIRLVLDTEISGVKGKELWYIVKNDNTVWSIIFGTPRDEFEVRLPVFEQVVQTFKILE